MFEGSMAARRSSYPEELTKLLATTQAVLRHSGRELDRLLIAASQAPLVVVGSGGSFAGALYLAACHREVTGQVAIAMTPLEFSHSRQVVRGSSVIVISGGGRNRDSIGSLERAIGWEADEVGVISATQGSPLSALGLRYQDSVRVVVGDHE